jgi:hypothetical protein
MDVLAVVQLWSRGIDCFYENTDNFKYDFSPNWQLFGDLCDKRIRKG